MANAGETDRAIDWLEESIRRDASPLDWYFGNLAIAYYHAGRPADAVAQIQKRKAPLDVILAAAYARLGKLDEARASIARLLSYKPGWTLQKEAVWPSGKNPQFVEPLQSAFLAICAVGHVGYVLGDADLTPTNRRRSSRGCVISMGCLVSAIT